MGREIKRVTLDFNWPLNMVWKGYINPYRPQECKTCEGSGLNKETKQIYDDWYDFADTGRKWSNNITQDEVDALIREQRLVDFTHKYVKDEGWKPIDPPPQITAEMVNKWSSKGFGHDSINQWICVKTRAEKFGIYGECFFCKGEGKIWFNDKVKELHENWYDNERYGPPTGEGWQVWETVSEGSPVTPVLSTREALIEYLVQHGDAWDQKQGDGGWKRENAEAFVKNEHAMSLAMVVAEEGVKILTPRDGA